MGLWPPNTTTGFPGAALADYETLDVWLGIDGWDAATQ